MFVTFSKSGLNSGVWLHYFKNLKIVWSKMNLIKPYFLHAQKKAVCGQVLKLIWLKQVSEFFFQQRWNSYTSLVTCFNKKSKQKLILVLFELCVLFWFFFIIVAILLSFLFRSWSVWLKYWTQTLSLASNSG